ncbi:MAG TPA: 23S rRNA (pseudouridine(1915)-N(3))-methyltransferase RlmH [Candidatus Baltobacteraceae bacterium]|nr:23S rRNA (pseudouridine(1915)-N(3))-methyltransferase RlmH [Candidatus Baltobacteraceae bacterium]
MIVLVIAVDRIRSPYVSSACAEFQKRLGAYYSYEAVEVRPGDGRDPATAMREECARIARQLRDDDRVWLLDRGGKQLSSPGLAQRLDDVGRSGAQRLCLVIGGAFGTDATLHARAEFTWSLSELTFLHEWARMIVLEQLYRAAKIARNEPYHH